MLSLPKREKAFGNGAVFRICRYEQLVKIYNLLRYMPGEGQNILKWGDIIRIHGVNLSK